MRSLGFKLGNSVAISVLCKVIQAVLGGGR